jgi:ABC-type branched-subunit amino acid transport system substrate-binding protein
MIKKIIAIIAALALLPAALLGCGQQAPPAEEEVVKIGCVLSMSGALGAMGTKMNQAAELAVEEINAAGGINGKQVELLSEDDATDAAQCLTAVKKLVEIDGVQLMVAGMTSGAANTIGPYLAERQVLALSSSATSPALTGQPWRNWFFRTVPSDAFQGQAMAQLALNEGLQRMVVFAMDNPYGIGLGEAAQGTLTEAGVEILAFIKYDPAKMDYRTELTKIKGLNPDGVIHVGYNDDGRVVYRQASELGLDTFRWIACDGLYGTGMLETEASATFMSKAVIGTRPAAPEGLAEYEGFKAAFETKFGTGPEVFCDTTYDAIKLIALAANRAGSEDPVAVQAALLEVGQGYQGASGTITFDAGGDRVSGLYEVWKVVEEGGEFKFTRTDTIAPE